MNDIKIYTLDEMTNILKVARKTMYSFIKNGKLKAFKVGRDWRITETALNEFIENMSKNK